MALSEQVVSAEREKLKACMTCPLCNHFFRDATTICECLHTFCRKCIYEKMADDEMCPVCNIKLGVARLKKLRADRSLQDLINKIFPSKRRKPKVHEAVSSVRAPVKRKEKSLSSLVASRVSAKSLLIGKRLKSIARRNAILPESVVPIEDPVKEVDDCQESVFSPETPRKTAQPKRQNFSSDESYKQHKPRKDAEIGVMQCQENSDLLKPLRSFVEATRKTKTNKSILQESLAQIEQHDIKENGSDMIKSDIKKNGNKSKVNGSESNCTPSSSAVKHEKVQRAQRKTAAVYEGLTISAQAVIDANSECDDRYIPIWFSLIASDDQEADAPLPQISSCYLRVKDGSIPVSSIKRYLVQKLGLVSEAEVEISLHGQALLPSLQLRHLVDCWVQTAPISEGIPITIGSSAKDFMMVLSYARKA